LEVAIELQKNKTDITLTEAYVHQALVAGLKKLFGEVGASYPIEIEKLEQTDYGALIIVRCPAFCYIKIHSSITLINSFQSQPCAFHVTRVGTNLLELFNSQRKIVL